MKLANFCAGVTAVFLSCLFGSEVVHYDYMLIVLFLSCLFGSEVNNTNQEYGFKFLSCLFGSEDRIGDGEASVTISKLPIRQ